MKRLQEEISTLRASGSTSPEACPSCRKRGESDPLRASPITLCFPDDEKTCFACCPPIRPRAYEHIQFKNTVKRVLRENTAAFVEQDRAVRPIRGFSCWALGYLDRRYRLVGCLLHPARNRGLDLRFRVDYGDKCRRETCPEARIFSIMGLHEKKFWLGLAAGFDSFAYSSRKANPLFELMGWGSSLLNQISSVEGHRPFERESFFEIYPFFSTKVVSKANAYLVNRLVGRSNIDLLRSTLFRDEFERFSERVSADLMQQGPENSDAPFVHLLPIDQDFRNLLRLSARIPRLSVKGALHLKEMVDAELDNFSSSLS